MSTAIPLTPEVLVSAYTHGIFPMDVGGQVEWFSPDPRAILPLNAFRVSKNLARRCRSRRFEIRLNTCFEQVIRACGDREEGTWISNEIVTAYLRLHELGLAHSVETWQDGELTGGLYGVALRGAFFGESMFHRRTDASKVALVALVEQLRNRGFTLLDVQFTTPHLEQFGIVEIPRQEYLDRLAAALDVDAQFVDPAAPPP
ncbi:MAG TPA: leucyl/phenylalanyl-tRNA--protein transferase [Phycisphaerae bacterium]|nr:leucyl/phenylalanyl-tRNA--protein transferase [Phycisphaerae bacterium]HRY67591.1 leucyl/phenylalanyl-tRNA--protein transferase [Phycisphaerae bacterium]HSA24978.1 leucyl/phenylalanyl-tRNA--protein transferase [Phycisphaerae bacterium]